MIVYKTVVTKKKLPDGTIVKREEETWYDTERDRKLTRQEDIDRARYASRMPLTSMDRIMDAYLEDFEERHCQW